MKLSDLMTNWSGSNPDVSGVALDSRKVESGFLFAALKGTNLDGRKFINKALENGAVCILTHVGTPQPDMPDCIAWVAVDDPAAELAKISARFYIPQPKHHVCITGTNGKTSVADMVRQIWQLCGVQGASVGTLGVIADGYYQDLGMTSPDPVTLHQELSKLAKSDISHVALEASSHGLEQRRLEGVKPDIIAFTNFTQDHLDYHNTMDEYRRAKLRLFTELADADSCAVVNADGAGADAFINAAKQRGLPLKTVGVSGYDLTLEKSDVYGDGFALSFNLSNKTYDIHLPLVGRFQVDNALLAFMIAVQSGCLIDDAVVALSKLQPIRGRMQRVGSHPVYVDYAHTPDGLETALKSLRPHCSGKLHLVFGCGGDRDQEKRQVMGQIAGNLADYIVVTDDNPRSESPDDIRAMVMVGCPEAENIGDREQAIRHAISVLEKDDVLLVAGKGHETGQIYGDQVRPFNDVDVTEKILQVAHV